MPAPLPQTLLGSGDGGLGGLCAGDYDPDVSVDSHMQTAQNTEVLLLSIAFLRKWSVDTHVYSMASRQLVVRFDRLELC
jgi:hypothetical protein